MELKVVGYSLTIFNKEGELIDYIIDDDLKEIFKIQKTIKLDPNKYDMIIGTIKSNMTGAGEWK